MFCPCWDDSLSRSQNFNVSVLVPDDVILLLANVRWELVVNDSLRLPTIPYQVVNRVGFQLAAVRFDASRLFLRPQAPTH